MEAALRLVSETDNTALFPWPETGEGLTFAEATHRVRDVLDERDGLVTLTRKQAAENARLQRRIEEEADPNSHGQGAEIVALIERWKRGADHPGSKISADRVKLVKARLKDGYQIASEEWLPDHVTLELAVDGICAHRFVCNGQRSRSGSLAQRHDRLGIALGGGEKVEEFARLGYKARKAGWTPEGGWPS